MITIYDAPASEIGPVTLYQLLALRVDVFVVEQHCPYRELDGRDLEPEARLIWATAPSDAEPVATLRLLRDPDRSWRIGRVATARAVRSTGIAARLMNHALELTHRYGPGHDIVLDAQVQLAGWYARFGFVADGPDFDEDAIRHRPMRRPADRPPTGIPDSSPDRDTSHSA